MAPGPDPIGPHPTLVFRALHPNSVLSVDSDAYPGRGLSLPQLAFALNKELGRATHSSLCVTKHTRQSSTRSRAKYLHSFTWTRFLNSSVTLQTRLQPPASGRTPFAASTASRWMSSHSSPPISLPNRLSSVRLSCAVVGPRLSFNTARYGPSCSSKKAMSTQKPSSNVQRGLHWMSSPIAVTPSPSVQQSYSPLILDKSDLSILHSPVGQKSQHSVALSSDRSHSSAPLKLRRSYPPAKTSNPAL